MRQLFVILLSALYISLTIGSGIFPGTNEYVRKHQNSSSQFTKGFGSNEHCKQCKRYQSVHFSVKSVKADLTAVPAKPTHNSLLFHCWEDGANTRPVGSFTGPPLNNVPLYLSFRSILI